MRRLDRGLSARKREEAKLDSSLAIVNIVLLLIFFFLASGSMLTSRGVTIALPDTEDLPLDMLPEPLLEILNSGEMYLNGEPIERGSLSALAADFRVLHILTDKENNALNVLTALAEENLSGPEIKLVTIHRSGESGG